MKVRRKPSAAYRRDRSAAIKKRFKRIMTYLLSLAFLSILIGVIYYYRTADFFPITNVRLFVSQPYINTARLKQLISRELKGNFFTVSLNSIVKTLLADDQIKSVNIERIWPNSLSIHVNGYKPIAFFNKDSVITAKGYIFKTPKGLTMPLNVYLKGPTNQAKEMIKRLQSFNQMLTPLKLTVRSIQLDNNMLTTMTLSNGLNLTLGKHQLDQRLSRFVSLYSKVIGHCQDNVSSIDLRYANGLAIKWNDKGKCISP
jgi:cell division protein FtsQ